MKNDKFKNKYRIQSHRMPGWDYSGNGFYFITLVTQNRECNLGEIRRPENGKSYIKLSDFGKIVDDEWKKSFEIRDELYCDEYIIMPNHLHAIVILKKPQSDKSPKSIAQPRFFRKPKSISSFIGGFKSAVNSKINDYIDRNKINIPKYNRNNHFFQPNYHDHIIRNENEYYRIKNYIINNPVNWNDDAFKSPNWGQKQ